MHIINDAHIYMQADELRIWMQRAKWHSENHYKENA